MTTETNLTFTLGETWTIAFALNDDAGDDIDLTGATVAFRLKRRGVLVLDLDTDGADVVITTPATGEGTITVTPTDQADLFPAVYDYEVRATLATNVVTTQARGALTVSPTLFT